MLKTALFGLLVVCMISCHFSSAAPSQTEDEAKAQTLDGDAGLEDAPADSPLGNGGDDNKQIDELSDQADNNSPEEHSPDNMEDGEERAERGEQDKQEHREGEGEEHDDKHEDKHDDKHDDHHRWSYLGSYGPSNWSLLVPDCNSSNRRQSPIDIVTDKTHLDDTLDEITLTPLTDETAVLVMKNNGHTVNLKFDIGVRVLGGALNDNYRVGGVHFHWGNSDKLGSEHKVDGRHFPFEMHIVTYDESRFDTLDARAIFGDDSLAVLGVLFEISEENNTALDPIIAHLHAVQPAGSSENISYFDLSSLLPTGTDKYYRYHGSLTTPPCAQSVIWTVFEHKQTISSKQLAEFRLLQEGSDEHGKVDYLDHNWRPVQPLHYRKVQRSFLLPKRKSDVVLSDKIQTGQGATGKKDGTVKEKGPMKLESNYNAASRSVLGLSTYINACTLISIVVAYVYIRSD